MTADQIVLDLLRRYLANDWRVEGPRPFKYVQVHADEVARWAGVVGVDLRGWPDASA